APLLQAISGERAAALRWVVSGGESMAPWVRDAFPAALPASTLVNAFGPTEAGPVTDNVIPRGSSGPTVPVGRPAPNFRITILDGDLDLVPVGMAGEAYVSGEIGLAHGYWRAPARRHGATDLDPAALREHAAALLPEHMLPDRILPVGRIPATVNGKTDEDELIRLWQEAADRERSLVAPTDDLEATLVEIYGR